ncbi:MAG: SMP-30/gluconolactonase/LRE family protein [Melioribacteraceae bacterium]|nr:SMP-30/gluconolactonase/LRE family protein [Melioribacteraceae bacterium]
MRHNSVLFHFLIYTFSFFTLINTQNVCQSILDPDAEVEEIATGIEQPEGPVWKDGSGLLFSDIKGNKIYKWTEENGKQIFLDPSDSTNGLTYDSEGRLIAGQMGLRRIVRFEDDGSQTSLADKYEGKRFNSPNDLIVKSDGSVFFTDPDFNIPGGQKNKELSFNGIYRISTEGNVQLLATLTLPNGICFSPDEKKLYVNDSQAHKIYVWDVTDDSTITNKKLLYTIPVWGYADGMKTDKDGNIYCTCSSAVWVISSSGELIGKIDLPSNVSASNCAWGGTDSKTLFITAGNAVYKIRPLITGVDKRNSIQPEKLKLFQNYPNPFNPSTILNFYLPSRSFIILEVYNITGEKIDTILNGILQKGSHEIHWSARNLASGIYIYSIQSGKFFDSKKMMLRK